MKQIIPLLYFQLHVNIIGLPVYYCSHYVKNFKDASPSRFFKTKEIFKSLDYEQQLITN
jgi:hypothetical protein